MRVATEITPTAAYPPRSERNQGVSMGPAQIPRHVRCTKPVNEKANSIAKMGGGGGAFASINSVHGGDARCLMFGERLKYRETSVEVRRLQ
jgi:hypothetical protein